MSLLLATAGVLRPPASVPLADGDIFDNGTAITTQTDIADGLNAVTRPTDIADGGGVTLPAWAPDDITSLAMWIDFSDAATVTGNPMTAVSDKSGNGRNLAQSAGAVAIGTINSLNAANFVDSKRFSFTPSFSGVALTGIVAYEPDVASGYLLLGSTNTTNGRAYVNANGATFGSGPAVAISPSTGTPHVFAASVPATSGASTCSVWLDTYGTATATGSVTMSATPYNSTGGVGGHTNGTGLFDGRIGEILVYEEQLTGTDLQNAMTYLANKWGATLS